MARAMLDGALMFPSEFITAEELNGYDMALTIRGVKRDELKMEGGKCKPGIVVTFDETPKKLVLNKTNSKTVAGLHGVEAKKWVGKRIAIYPTTCKFAKETVSCIRVRERVPASSGSAQKPQCAEPFADWIQRVGDMARESGWSPDDYDGMVSLLCKSKKFNTLEDGDDAFRASFESGIRDGKLVLWWTKNSGSK